MAVLFSRTRFGIQSWIACVTLGYALSSCLAQESHSGEEGQTRSAMEGIAILPSRTDPEIKTFDFPHHLHVDRDIVIRKAPEKAAERHELLLWLTGTGGRSRGAEEFCKLAASQGYHVIKLMYPDDIPATVCKRDEDPKSFEEFRLSIIQGGKGPHISIPRAESIENRLIKLLKLLSQIRARENWGQFLDESGDLVWEKLVPAGQSQGGGHAFLIGMKHPVARVIGSGGPKDWSLMSARSAAWLVGESATPKERFFTFNHQQDYQGCTPEQQWATLDAFGLTKFAPLVSVDEKRAPFDHSRCLTTDYPGGKLESGPAHTSVIANKNADLFRPVWLYMLTAPLSVAAGAHYQPAKAEY